MFQLFISRLFMIIVLCGASHSLRAEIFHTPFESHSSFKLPGSQQVSAFLAEVSKRSKKAEVMALGTSAGGRPVEALLVSNEARFLESGRSDADKLTVMLIGAQHGNEPSGAEALQQLARDVALDNDHPWLASMNLVIVALANPDGRDLGSRFNAARENPNIDYVAVEANETQMYIEAINQFKPHVLLDVHEAGVAKPRLTRQQGYYTDVQAQFEVGNNPNIDTDLRQFSDSHFLPQLIKRVRQAGLPAQPYRGKIDRLEQPVRRGGFGISNLRNYAAMQGSLSVLLENRKDKKEGQYASPRNIQQRVAKQALSINTFLSQVKDDASTILRITQQAAQTESAKIARRDPMIAMEVAFALNTNQPTVKVPLTQKTTGKNILHTFDNHNLILAEQKQLLPEAYAITDHQKQFAVWLDKHHIQYQKVKKTINQKVNKWAVKNLSVRKKTRSEIKDTVRYNLRERFKEVNLKPGDLIIPMDQPKAKLAAAMLDPRSSSTIFQEPRWRSYLKESYLPLSIVGEPKEGEQKAVAEKNVAETTAFFPAQSGLMPLPLE